METLSLDRRRIEFPAARRQKGVRHVPANEHPTGERPPAHPTPRRVGAVVAVLLAALLAAAQPAAALTYIMPSDESMVDRTGTIVFGRVLSAAAAPDGLPMPATDFTVAVEEVLKGFVADSTIVVRQPGGARPDGLAMRIPGLPMLQDGERVLLFLAGQDAGEDGAWAFYRVVEFGLGIFFEVPVEGGVLLEREPSLRHDIIETGPDAGAETVVGLRDGGRFRSWIRERAAGARRAADYFVPEREVVRGPTAVRQPYEFLRTRGSCTYPNWTIRWVEFERGESVDFGIQQGGQPGLSEASTQAAVSNAMSAWNNDPSSGVDLRYRPNPVPPEASGYRDGRNLFMFDDPFNLRGALEPEGGTIGWADVWTWCDDPPVPRPPPYANVSDVRIAQADIYTRRGLGLQLTFLFGGNEERIRTYIEELLGHELGHSLGFGHPCKGGAAGDCDTPAEDEALMRGVHHGDGRGARLSSDDQEILEQVYPATAGGLPPTALTAPTGLRATPTGSKTVHVVWTDRSGNEDGFQVWTRLEGDDWEEAATRPANAEEAWVYGLQPGGQYRFFVRALRGDLQADSDSVAVTMPRGEPAPSPPTGLRVTPTNTTTVHLVWTDRSDDEDGFQVWTRLEGDDWEEAATRPANAEEAWVYGLQPGGQYRFFVRALHGDLQADSDSVAVTMPRGEPAPSPPTGLRVTPTNTTTVHVVWTDRSDDEDRFVVRKQLEGDDWEEAATRPANAEEAYVDDLQPGGRYLFVVRATRGDLHADSDSVAVTMPSREPGTLQAARFDVDFSATANDAETVGKPAGWSSDQGVLYWLFDSGNPEALAKVLDGRSINGHWWFDLAVASDLPSVARVAHRETGDEWVAITGFGRDVFRDPGDAANRLVHCAYPANRADNQCAFRGYGTTISLRDAWDPSGRIPPKYFEASTASSHGNQTEAGSLQVRPTRRGLYSDSDSAAVTAPRPVSSIGSRIGFGVSADATEPATLQGSQFGVDFSARANDATTTGRSGWSSDQGVLYWLFDSGNPEALVKVLDGRSINGHWWFDLAVASDLRSVARVVHRGAGDEWVAITGFGRDVFRDPGAAADRLVHCAYPANRTDNQCAVTGYGTTISLRDAWDSSGRIPAIHYD